MSVVTLFCVYRMLYCHWLFQVLCCVVATCLSYMAIDSSVVMLNMSEQMVAGSVLPDIFQVLDIYVVLTSLKRMGKGLSVMGGNLSVFSSL